LLIQFKTLKTVQTQAIIRVIPVDVIVANWFQLVKSFFRQHRSRCDADVRIDQG